MQFIIRNIYLVFIQLLAGAPKTFGISCDETDKDVFCYTNEASFGLPWRCGGWSSIEPALRIGTFNRTPDRQGGKRDWRLSSVTNCCSVTYNSMRPHGLQHTRLPCPSSSPGVCSNSRPLSHDAIQPSHPTITPFSSCPQEYWSG